MDKTLVYEIGIDEAGRGPVLGSMIYGGAIWPEGFENNTIIKQSALNDSKKLTEEERDQLMLMLKGLKLKNKMDYHTIDLDPKTLSSTMMGDNGISLNDVSHNAAIKIIHHFLSLGVKISTVYVDVVGPQERYQNLLETVFKGKGLKFVVEKKADAKFKVVSAASIVAKTLRDRILREWKFEENVEIDSDFGCGYPSDPLTKSWLQRNCDHVFGLPTLVRYSWKTCEHVLEQKCVPFKFLDNELEIDSDKLRQYSVDVPKSFKSSINKYDLYMDFKDTFGTEKDFVL